MRLGIVAREFPPATGGMAIHAYELVQSLSRYCDVVVFTNVEHAGHCYDLNVPIKAVLERNLWKDAAHVREAGPVDVILTLNAGYAPLSFLQEAPVFSYCHGNDYLSPWILSLSRHQGMAVGVMGRTPYLRERTMAIQRRIFRSRVAKGLNHARHVFANSTYTKNRIGIEFPWLRVPISVTPPGLPACFFDAGGGGGKRRAGDGPLRLLTVARLASVARKKNVDNILRALALLGNDVPFEYRIIGDGDLRTELEVLAANLGLGDRVAFLGARDRDDVIRWLDASDLFVLPSLASEWDVESFGIVYVEAAARGVPSLLSRAGGATDAVQEGISGIVIEHSDPVSIADGIRRFSAHRDRFHSEAITTFADRFRWDSVSREIWSIIQTHAAHEDSP